LPCPDEKHPSKADTSNIPKSKHTKKEMIRKIRTKNYIRSESPTNKTQNRFKVLKPERKIQMKENTQFIIEELDKKDFFSYSYNVKIIKDGYYCGIGKYCRNLKEAADFIQKFEKGE
jgi:hypothetical protein